MGQSIKGVPKLETSPGSFYYRDRGCEVSPSCLSCPLVECKYDTPRKQTRDQVSARATHIQAARREGKTLAAVAAEVGCSLRTVSRGLNF